MNTTRERVKGSIDNAASRAHQVTDAAADRAKKGTEQAAGMVEAIGDKAHDVAAAVGDYAGHAKDSVQKIAGRVAGSVVHVKDAVVDWAGDASRHPGQTIRAGTDDVAGLIRSYPVPALLVGIGIGFMLAKTFRA